MPNETGARRVALAARSTNQMKTIYIIYGCGEETGEYDLVFDEMLKTIDGWSCNDANWRGEYFNDLMTKLGIEILEKHPKLTEKFVDKAAKKFFGL